MTSDWAVPIAGFLLFPLSKTSLLEEADFLLYRLLDAVNFHPRSSIDRMRLSEGCDVGAIPAEDTMGA